MTSFDHWYKKSIESRQEDPPEALWEAIQNELDVEVVWTRLDGALPVNNRKPIYSILAVAASLALLITAGIWMFNKTEYMIPERSPAILADDALIPIERMPVRPLEMNYDHTISTRTSLTSTPGSVASLMPVMSTSPSYLPPSRSLGLPVPLASSGSELLAERKLSPSERYIYPEEGFTEGSRQTDRSWQIGVSGQLANTWMVNTKTIEGLQSDHLTTTNTTFGNNIGLHATWLVNSRLRVKNEWQLLSRTGQSYHEYINGQYVATSLDLKYINTAILFFYHPFQHKPPHALAFGLYAGMLQEATRQKNGDMERITADYASFDYGLLMGYEYEHRLGKAFSIGTGVYTRFGLTNIFAGNTLVPAYLNQTRNAAFLLSVSLNYQFQ